MQFTVNDGVCYHLAIETQAIIDKRAYITNLGVFLQVYFVLVRLPLLVGCPAAGTGLLLLQKLPFMGPAEEEKKKKMEKGTELSGGASDQS